MGPFTLYLILPYWVYPLKEYLGETGCYLMDYARNIAMMAMQLQSFFQSVFRYICLFHEDILFKFNLSPNVSDKSSKITLHNTDHTFCTFLTGDGKVYFP